MSKQPSLLSRVNSKYILKNILSLAYSDMKSVFKLVAYNKNLLKKLDINIKDYYQYDIKLKNFKKNLQLVIMDFSCVLLIFILLLQYTIKFLKKGSLNDKILKEGYNVHKKNFVDFMDKYILIPYLIFIILRFVFDTLLLRAKKLLLT